MVCSMTGEVLTGAVVVGQGSFELVVVKAYMLLNTANDDAHSPLPLQFRRSFSQGSATAHINNTRRV